MAIYRGVGGSGDATNDASNQSVIALAAAQAAQTSANSAASSASAASGSATSAAVSAQNAADSAASLDTTSFLTKADNLDSLTDVAVARSNLGLGSAATTASTDYATSAHTHTGLYEPANATILKSANIGVTVQGYDIDTAKLDVAQNYTAPQRAALAVDNDGNFNLAANQNFSCTPTGAVTLTFSSQADGLSGSIIYVNGSNYATSAHSTTKLTATDLTKLSTSGTYRIDYISNGTNAYCSVVGPY
jgi:hypothetical protein